MKTIRWLTSEASVLPDMKNSGAIGQLVRPCRGAYRAAAGRVWVGALCGFTLVASGQGGANVSVSTLHSLRDPAEGRQDPHHALAMSALPGYAPSNCMALCNTPALSMLTHALHMPSWPGRVACRCPSCRASARPCTGRRWCWRRCRRCTTSASSTSASTWRWRPQAASCHTCAGETQGLRGATLPPCRLRSCELSQAEGLGFRAPEPGRPDSSADILRPSLQTHTCTHALTSSMLAASETPVTVSRPQVCVRACGSSSSSRGSRWRE